MNGENKQLNTLRTLILKSQSEQLTAAETAQLNDLAHANGGSQEAAALIDQLCALSDSGAMDSLPMTELLADALGSPTPLKTEQSSADASPQFEVHVAKSIDRKKYGVLALLVSHLLVAAAVWGLLQTERLESHSESVDDITYGLPPQFVSNATPQSSLEVQSGNTAEPQISPQLVSTIACVWRPSGDSIPAVGQSIDTGDELNLLEGIAELRVAEGTAAEAVVRIEAPANLYIRLDGQLGLLHGSMTAKSLGTGREAVTIGTPFGTVYLDGQSSIGLASDNSGSEIHLFNGRALVELESGQMDSSANEIRMESGEAMRVSSRSSSGYHVVKFGASEANFVSARSLGFDPLNLDAAYISAIAASAPCIYWRFEEVKGDSTSYIENLGSAAGMDALVVGTPGWRQYGDNRVAEMGMSTSSAFRALKPWPEKPLHEYTIEMWVKPLLFHHGEVLCLHAVQPLDDGRYPHTMMLETTAQHYFSHRLSDSPANRFRFVHRQLSSVDPISATSMFSENEYRSRVWQHVVTQKKGDQQLLWIDGKLSAAQPNSQPLTDGVQVLIGQVYPTSVYRRFVGQIDEVAIYDRCLTPEELREHIKAANRVPAIR